MEYLEYNIGNGNKVQPSERKAKAVMKFPELASIKSVQSF
jgi:hypothetical protein